MAGLDDDSLAFGIAAFVCGIFVLERGADRFIDSSAAVARRLGISPTLVGLLTCGAEWEELVVILVAVGQRQSSLALGNLMGSAVANVLGSFSLGVLLAGPDMAFDRSSKIYTAISLGLTSAFLLLLYVVPPRLGWAAGAALLVAFVVYVASVTRLIYQGTLRAPEDSDSGSGTDSASDSDSDGPFEPFRDEDSTVGDGAQAAGRRSSESPHAPEASAPPSADNDRQSGETAGRGQREPMRRHLVQLLLGLFMLVVSGYVVARSASVIGDGLGLSGTVTGTTILSIATTLPEKFVAVMAGSRREPGLMVANTVGSNIFLMTLCGGILFIWGGKDMRSHVSLNEALAMWASAGILLFVILVRAWRRIMGLVMLGGYVLFLALEVRNGLYPDTD